MSDMDSTNDSGVSGVTASQASGESGTPNSIDTAKIVAEVLKQLDPVLDKKVQSVKDKRFESIEQRYAKSLEKQGLTPEDAKEIADRLPKPANTSDESVPSKPSGKVVETGAIADKVLEVAGLASDDPDVTAFKQRVFANETARDLEAINLVARKQSNPAIPKAPATVISSPERTKEMVTKELFALNKNPVGNKEGLKKLREELAQLDK
jgi:hypothetical protein